MGSRWNFGLISEFPARLCGFVSEFRPYIGIFGLAKRFRVGIATLLLDFRSDLVVSYRNFDLISEFPAFLCGFAFECRPYS